MKELTTLSVVIPCYNNAATIEQAIAQAWEVGLDGANKLEVIVCNDASTDKSGIILGKLQKKYKELRILEHIVNMGYGATIKELYFAAKYDWLFSVPGDFQVGAEELMTMLKAKDEGDMVVGWRVDRQDPANRLVQSKIYNTILGVLFGLWLHDVNSVRLMRTELFRSLRLTSTSAFVDAELAIRLVRQGYKIVEIPIKHRDDASRLKPGSGGGSLRTIIPTIADMIKFWLTA